MKHSNLYFGLVLPSGGWQSLIMLKSFMKSTPVYFLENFPQSKHSSLFCSALSDEEEKRIYNIDDRWRNRNNEGTGQRGPTDVTIALQGFYAIKLFFNLSLKVRSNKLESLSLVWYFRARLKLNLGPLFLSKNIKLSLQCMSGTNTLTYFVAVK